MSAFGTVGMCTAAIAVNTSYTVAHKYDPFPTILAGSVIMGVCVSLGAVRPELGTGLAAIFLLGSAITRGDYFVNMVSDLATSKPAKPKGKP